MYPGQKAFSKATPARIKMFDMVCGSPKVRELFQENYKVKDMADYWNKDVEAFTARAEIYRLYE